MKIAVIDNYDSFVYNLVHYLESLNCEVVVFRNDEIEFESLAGFDKILLSPGPGLPKDAGSLRDIIEKYGGLKSILGVCLGQQAIGEVYGGKLEQLEDVRHGVATMAKVLRDDEYLFSGLGKEFKIGHYHSWVVSNENFPETLEITSVDSDGNIMSLRHRQHDIRAVQFHPESILTPQGKKIIENWVNG